MNTINLPVLLALGSSFYWVLGLLVVGFILAVNAKKGEEGKEIVGFLMVAVAVIWMGLAILAIPYNWIFGGEETAADEESNSTVVDGGSNSGYVPSTSQDTSEQKEVHTPIWDSVKPGSQTHVGGEMEETLLAARTGNANAQLKMGVRYKDGDGVPQDYSQAKDWFLKAANNGEPGGAFYLGYMYAEGQGVEKDLYQSAQWYLAAAKAGVKEAQFNLALILWDGIGVRQDKEDGLHWMRKAAIQDMAKAQYYMGVYLGDSFGVTRNRSLSLAWLVIAGKNNYPKAEDKYIEVASRATQAERDNAVTLARGLTVEIQQNRFR